ncbi:hypothetical protein OH76DRAFT_1067719 [Lentinus brumalis]|uniref:Uncharacterized protein n=1 Tax=Lentinus brumalis TaxID=2498619 RepID=A0A371DNP5_9APHY|nr:hypothetical protein OH76DRAFT_1067719 [Polyporus brumalis]
MIPFLPHRRPYARCIIRFPCSNPPFGLVMCESAVEFCIAKPPPPSQVSILQGIGYRTQDDLPTMSRSAIKSGHDHSDITDHEPYKPPVYGSSGCWPSASLFTQVFRDATGAWYVCKFSWLLSAFSSLRGKYDRKFVPSKSRLVQPKILEQAPSS